MQIFIAVHADLHHGDKKTIALDVDAFDKIAVVKALIQAQEGTPTHHLALGEPGVIGLSYYYEGYPGMADGRTLSDYKVKDGMTLQMALVCVIFVRTLPGKTITIHVSPRYETIDHVKAQIRDKEGIPPYQQRLIFKGLVLKSRRILSFYGICDGAELSLVRVEDEQSLCCWSRRTSSHHLCSAGSECQEDKKTFLEDLIRR